MDAQGAKITIVQQNGKWVVSLTTDGYSSHRSFDTEAEARQFVRRLSVEHPRIADEA